MIPESAVISPAFLVVWPPAQFRVIPMPATPAQRALAARLRQGAGPLPMAVRLAVMLPLARACRRQRAHVVADQR
jgi:hypothetical protein